MDPGEDDGQGADGDVEVDGEILDQDVGGRGDVRDPVEKPRQLVSPVRHEVGDGGVVVDTTEEALATRLDRRRQHGGVREEGADPITVAVCDVDEGRAVVDTPADGVAKPGDPGGHGVEDGDQVGGVDRAEEHGGSRQHIGEIGTRGGSPDLVARRQERTLLLGRSGDEVDELRTEHRQGFDAGLGRDRHRDTGIHPHRDPHLRVVEQFDATDRPDRHATELHLGRAVGEQSLRRGREHRRQLVATVEVAAAVGEDDDEHARREHRDDHAETGQEPGLAHGRHPVRLTVVVVPQKTYDRIRLVTTTVTMVMRMATPTARPTPAGPPLAW